MKRSRQTLEEIVAALSPVASSWIDDHSIAVVEAINQILEKEAYGKADLREILDRNYEAGLTAIRLALDLSKDEFTLILREKLGAGGVGISMYRRDPDCIVTALHEIEAGRLLKKIVHAPVSWRSPLIERLKTGRGNAIKGQSRGRALENTVESIVLSVFGGGCYDVRCRFLGARGTSTEKADFAVPSKNDPRILIEAKAYGATGCKQTDILGDISRIIAQKRHDTNFLLVVDGVTWKMRLNDLRRMIQYQNEGQILRIYTQSMAEDLRSDLLQLKQEHDL